MKKLLALAVGLLAVSSPTFAADVVKIMNFSCPVCRASENLDPGIQEAVAASGGRFVPAPVPADDTSGARERVYYAARLQGEAVAQSVRKSLYKGSQDMQMPLDDVAQTVSWLQDDLAGNQVNVNWNQLIQDSQGSAADAALVRAARLALKGGGQGLPLYIVMQNNRVVASFDPQSTGTGSLLTLRDAVVKAVNQAK